jgi:hypothetical protein
MLWLIQTMHRISVYDELERINREINKYIHVHPGKWALLGTSFQVPLSGLKRLHSNVGWKETEVRNSPRISKWEMKSGPIASVLTPLQVISGFID